jgi:hypothetical protein
MDVPRATRITAGEQQLVNISIELRERYKRSIFHCKSHDLVFTGTRTDHPTNQAHPYVDSTSSASDVGCQWSLAIIDIFGLEEEERRMAMMRELLDTSGYLVRSVPGELVTGTNAEYVGYYNRMCYNR